MLSQLGRVVSLVSSSSSPFTINIILKDGTDMNVQPAWESGFTGKGVVVTILGSIVTIVIIILRITKIFGNIVIIMLTITKILIVVFKILMIIVIEVLMVAMV